MLRPIGSALPLGAFTLVPAGMLMSGLQLGWFSPAQAKAIPLLLLGFAVPLQLLASTFGFLCCDAHVGHGIRDLCRDLACSRPGGRVQRPHEHQPGARRVLLELWSIVRAPDDRRFRRRQGGRRCGDPGRLGATRALRALRAQFQHRRRARGRNRRPRVRGDSGLRRRRGAGRGRRTARSCRWAVARGRAPRSTKASTRSSASFSRRPGFASSCKRAGPGGVSPLDPG
jgi:hypothetical protein